MNKLVYSSNNEDFDFDTAEECLDDMWEQGIIEQVIDGEVFVVYEGESTDIALFDPPGSYAVLPTRELKFMARVYETYCVPDWIPID